MAMNPEQAKAALDAGLLSKPTYDRVIGSAGQYKVPAEPGLVPVGVGAQMLSSIGNALSSPADLEIQAAQEAQAAAPVAVPVIDETQYQVAPAAASAVTSTLQPVAQPNTSAYDQAAGAVLNAAALGDRKAAELEAYTKSFEQKRAEETKLAQDDFDLKQSEVEKKLLSLDEKLNAIAEQKIDPNRIYSQMGVGEKIGTFVLASIAGEQGQKKLDDMIKRDIAAQENLKSGAMDAIKQQSSVYKDLMDTYKDKISVKNSLAASMYQAAQLKAEGLAAVTKNAQVKAALVEKAAELGMKKQEYIDEFAKRQQLLAAQSKPVAQLTVDQIPDDKLRERFVPGLGFAATKEDAAKLKEQGASTYAALGNINALKGYLNKSNRSLSLEDRAVINNEINTLIGKLRVEITGPGAMTEPERQLIENVIGNPGAIFSLDTTSKAKLLQLERMLKRSRKAAAQSYGINVPDTIEDVGSSERIK